MLTLAVVLLILGGIGWALIYINSLPMVMDMVEDARVGTYTGLYYLFATGLGNSGSQCQRVGGPVERE
jgi:MFS family permease